MAITPFIFPIEKWNKLHLQIIFYEENFVQLGDAMGPFVKFVKPAIQIEKNQ